MPNTIPAAPQFESEMLIRPGQAASILGFSPTTIYRLVRNGDLPVYRRTPGGHAMLSLRMVMAYRDSLTPVVADAVVEPVYVQLDNKPDGKNGKGGRSGGKKEQTAR